MAISKTQMKSRVRKKTNSYLAETIRLALKHPHWGEVAKVISGASSKHSALNLYQIDNQTKEGDTVIVPGKILSQGDLTKKLRLVSLSISDSAREKIKQSKSEFLTINEEIKKNPKAEGIKILR